MSHYEQAPQQSRGPRLWLWIAISVLLSCVLAFPSGIVFADARERDKLYRLGIEQDKLIKSIWVARDFQKSGDAYDVYRVELSLVDIQKPQITLSGISAKDKAKFSIVMAATANYTNEVGKPPTFQLGNIELVSLSGASLETGEYMDLSKISAADKKDFLNSFMKGKDSPIKSLEGKITVAHVGAGSLVLVMPDKSVLLLEPLSQESTDQKVDVKHPAKT